jgi:DeoR/GlpR family transcriptional regulator of sugar metabolism
LQLEPEYTQRAQRNVEEKRQIGILAASLIGDGDIVFINSGTTTTQVIRNIRSGAGITVITNNVAAALEMGDPGFEIILLGGYFQSTSNSVVGRFAIENLGQIYANQAFIGVDGITSHHGYSPFHGGSGGDPFDDRTHKGPVSIVSDYSKWGIVSNFEIAHIDRIQRLITDDRPDPRLSKRWRTGRSMCLWLAHHPERPDWETAGEPRNRQVFLILPGGKCMSFFSKTEETIHPHLLRHGYSRF